MSFDTLFEDGIRSLGLLELSQEINAEKLNSIRDSARGIFFGGRAEEAAVRAYRELVLLNPRISIEQRLEISFQNLIRIKQWRSQDKVNLDLLMATKQTTEELLSFYIGEEYENAYYEQLRQQGVVVPIKNDNFKIISDSYFFSMRRIGFTPEKIVHQLINNIYLKNKEGYASCMTEEARFVLKNAIPTE